MLLVALGLVAGTVTTIGGMGGGLLLVLALAAISGDPLAAIAQATPALLLGNVHRVSLFRDAIEWPKVLPFMLAGAPGAFLGGAFAVALPWWVLQACMIGGASLAVARLVGRVSWTVPTAALGPLGFGIGVASTAGAGGPLAGPVLLSAGLSGSAYLAAISLGALAMHLGRLAAFGVEGVVTGKVLASALWIAAAIMAGNAFGRWTRQHLGDRWTSRFEVGTAVAMVVLAVAGAAMGLASR